MLSYCCDLTPSEYNAMRQAVGWRPLSERQAAAGLAHTFLAIAVREEESGRIVGMGRVLFDFGYTAYLGDIIVRPEYQGRGIGRELVMRLMRAVEDEACQGERIMFLLGAARGKEGFYEKLGFAARPNEDSGAGMTRWYTK